MNTEFGLKHNNSCPIIEKKTYLTPYDWATYLHVWMLNDTYKSKLTMHEVRITDVRTFIEFTNIDHPWREVLTVDSVKFQLAYCECSFEYLEKLEETLPTTPLLLSFRYIKDTDLAIALVSLVKTVAVASNLHKYKRLIPGIEL